MFTKATPESVGVSSSSVFKYLKVLNDHELTCHSLLMARGDKMFCEAYWKPFCKTDKHRMYSQTKSYVGLAVRLLAEDGIIDLDDPIIKYFPEKLPETIHPYLEILTIRNMLMMQTCFIDHGKNWFTSNTDDRVKLYFSQNPSNMPGTQYSYDSMGSFIMAALVEKMTGKIFLDYLREKCLDEIGFSKDAYCLKCPGGYSWGDSALICTPEDMLKYGRFVGRKGEWNGKQIIPRHIIEDALADYSDTYEYGFRSYDHYGYASQFWIMNGRAVGFNGMHGQYTVYDPKTDITFTCTSGNHRSSTPPELIISYLFSEILDDAENEKPECKEDFEKLTEYINSLSLITVTGNDYSETEDKINGKIYYPEKNEQEIQWFSLNFENDVCTFNYKNAQGEKSIRFGRKQNIFQQFPQVGYSDIIGGQPSKDRTYECCASFAWETKGHLRMRVQIIDTYIGNVFMNVSFRDNYARIQMTGDAEHFLDEYDGNINAFYKE